MGPKNPEDAKEQYPDSLRAQFGQSILDNAVHGSSSTENALEVIEELFSEELAAEREGGEEQTEIPPSEES